MRYWILTCLLLLAFGSAHAIAGVVEDAEEEMKKLKQQQAESGQAVTQPSPGQSFSQPETTSSTNPSNEQTQSKAQGQRDAETRRAGHQVKEPQAERKRGKRVRKRDASDRLLSVLGIFLFLMLIIAGALYGKRSDSDT